MFALGIIGVAVLVGQLLKVRRDLFLREFHGVGSYRFQLWCAPKGGVGSARQALKRRVIQDTLLHPSYVGCFRRPKKGHCSREGVDLICGCRRLRGASFLGSDRGQGVGDIVDRPFKQHKLSKWVGICGVL